MIHPARALAIGLLLLSGCTMVQPGAGVPAEPDVPRGWSGSGTPFDPAAPAPAGAAVPATPLVAWWQRFGDATLSALVERAREANTRVREAQAALRQARALRDVAAGGLQPTLGSSASAQHGRRGGDSTGNSFQVGLDAGWELDVFGARRSALATGEASARASEASLADVQVSIAAEVGLAYVALRGAQERLAVAEANLASQRQTLQLTEWRVQAGLLSALETEQARAAAAQTAAQRPALQARLAQSAHALAVLTGLPPADLAALRDTPAPVPQPAGTLALSLPAETLRQRPDVRAAERQVQAAQGRVAQADAARYPDFRLGGSLGLSALKLGSLGAAPLVTQVVASVGLPLWDGGVARAQVRAQQAALDQTRSRYRATVLNALQEVEDALVALAGDRERVVQLQRAADAASAAAALADDRYRSGLVDFQTVLETQRSQRDAQDGAASARADVSADHIRLYKALGGGWQPDGSDPGDRTGAPSLSQAAAPAAAR